VVPVLLIKERDLAKQQLCLLLIKLGLLEFLSQGFSGLTATVCLLVALTKAVGLKLTVEAAR